MMEDEKIEAMARTIDDMKETVSEFADTFARKSNGDLHDLLKQQAQIVDDAQRMASAIETELQLRRLRTILGGV
jgi:uncharacterized protein Yka (UPF0111/DUF47 family)